MRNNICMTLIQYIHIPIQYEIKSNFGYCIGTEFLDLNFSQIKSWKSVINKKIDMIREKNSNKYTLSYSGL